MNQSKNLKIILISSLVTLNLFSMEAYKSEINKILMDTNKSKEARKKEATDLVKQKSGGTRRAVAKYVEEFDFSKFPYKKGAPPTNKLEDQKEYKDAKTAFDAFNANQTDKNLAQAFIDSYDALDNVKGNYTGTIPGTWTTLLSTAQNVVSAAPPPPPPVTIDISEVKRQNKAAVDQAHKVANKMKQLISDGTLQTSDANDLAQEWSFKTWTEMETFWAK